MVPPREWENKLVQSDLRSAADTGKCWEKVMQPRLRAACSAGALNRFAGIPVVAFGGVAVEPPPFDASHQLPDIEAEHGHVQGSLGRGIASDAVAINYIQGGPVKARG